MISDWLKRRGSAKMVTRDGLDYLWRVYLLARTSAKGVERVFFHVFCMSDPDPLHSHPWWWGRIILWGRYREYYLDSTYADCGPGHIVWRRDARDAHRVELLSDKVYTIFWHGAREAVWGFWKPFIHPRLGNGVWNGRSYEFHPAPEEAQDGREIRGTFLPRKVGEAPKG